MITAGVDFSVFVSSSHEVFACGRSKEGQCGAFDGDALFTPRQVPGLPKPCISSAVVVEINLH